MYSHVGAPWSFSLYFKHRGGIREFQSPPRFQSKNRSEIGRGREGWREEEEEGEREEEKEEEEEERAGGNWWKKKKK